MFVVKQSNGEVVGCIIRCLAVSVCSGNIPRQKQLYNAVLLLEAFVPSKLSLRCIDKCMHNRKQLGNSCKLTAFYIIPCFQVGSGFSRLGTAATIKGETWLLLTIALRQHFKPIMLFTLFPNTDYLVYPQNFWGGKYSI